MTHSAICPVVTADAGQVCVCNYSRQTPLPVHIMWDNTMADRRSIGVRVGSTMDTSTTYAFVGSATPGYPGPVIMAGAKHEVRVDAPERFGDTFNPDWVRAFFA